MQLTCIFLEQDKRSDEQKIDTISSPYNNKGKKWIDTISFTWKETVTT